MRRLPGAPPPPLETDVEDAGIDVLLEAARSREAGRMAMIPTPEDFARDTTGGLRFGDTDVGMVVRLMGEGLTYAEIGLKVRASDEQVRSLVKKIRRWVTKKTPTERGKRGAAATHARHGNARVGA